MIRVTLCTIKIQAWNLINFLFQHLLNLHCTGFLDSTRAEKIKSSLRNSVLLYLLYGKMRSRREKQENHFWSIIVIILLLFFRMYKMLRFLSNRGLVNSQRLIRIGTRWSRRLCAKFHLYMSILGLNIFTKRKNFDFLQILSSKS